MAAEVISTVERRRYWPDEEKRRIVSEALVPGASVAAVADRNGVCRSLVYLWLRLARTGRLPGVSLAGPPANPFVPVRIGPVRIGPPAQPVTAQCPPAAQIDRFGNARPQASVVEVMLGNGRRIKVEATIDPATLARLAAALDGSAP